MALRPHAPKHPELTPIRSSMMSGFHYNPDTRDLYVRMVSNGQVYVARDVAMERATAFAENLSKGRYFNEQIKPHHMIEKVG